MVDGMEGIPPCNAGLEKKKGRLNGYLPGSGLDMCSLFGRRRIREVEVELKVERRRK